MKTPHLIGWKFFSILEFQLASMTSSIAVQHRFIRNQEESGENEIGKDNLCKIYPHKNENFVLINLNFDYEKRGRLTLHATWHVSYIQTHTHKMTWYSKQWRISPSTAHRQSLSLKKCVAWRPYVSKSKSTRPWCFRCFPHHFVACQFLPLKWHDTAD